MAFLPEVAGVGGSIEVLQRALGFTEREAYLWGEQLRLVELAETSKGKALREAERGFLELGVIPLDAEEGLPPHVLALVPPSDPSAATCAHSQDLEGILRFPDVWAALAEEGEVRDDQVEAVARLLASPDGLTLGRRLLLSRRADRAARLMERLLDRRPEGLLVARLLLGRLEAQGRLGEADAMLSRLRPAIPQERTGLLIDRAWVLATRRDPAQAIALLRAGRGKGTSGGHDMVRTFLDFHEAMRLRGPEDAVRMTELLVDFLAEVMAFLDEVAPGARREAVRAYGRLPEAKVVRQASRVGRGKRLPESLSFGLYLAFAHRVPGIGDTPAEMFIDDGEVPHALTSLVNRAVRGARRGPFRVEAARSKGDRTLLRASDWATGEVLWVTFSVGGPTGSALREALRPGSLLRALLVPWGALWFSRGPIAVHDPKSVRGGRDHAHDAAVPIRWIVDGMPLSGSGTGWSCVVFDERSEMVLGVDLGLLPTPGCAAKALEGAVRTSQGEPDVVVTRPGFPFWHPREGSLLRTWTERFGVRHVCDEETVEALTREFRRSFRKIHWSSAGAGARGRRPSRRRR